MPTSTYRPDRNHGRGKADDYSRCRPVPPRPRIAFRVTGGEAMKGTTPTQEQKRFHDALCRFVGCAACRVHGWLTTLVSVHHIDGRTKPAAHWLVLPLCAGHHQDGTGAPGLIAVHPWKARFETKYGKQMDLLRRCIRFLLSMGVDVPAGAIDASGYQSDVGAQSC